MIFKLKERRCKHCGLLYTVLVSMGYRARGYCSEKCEKEESKPTEETG